MATSTITGTATELTSIIYGSTNYSLLWIKDSSAHYPVFIIAKNITYGSSFDAIDLNISYTYKMSGGVVNAAGLGTEISSLKKCSYTYKFVNTDYITLNNVKYYGKLLSTVTLPLTYITNTGLETIKKMKGLSGASITYDVDGIFNSSPNIITYIPLKATSGETIDWLDLINGPVLNTYSELSASISGESTYRGIIDLNKYSSTSKLTVSDFSDSRIVLESQKQLTYSVLLNKVRNFVYITTNNKTDKVSPKPIGLLEGWTPKQGYLNNQIVLKTDYIPIYYLYTGFILSYNQTKVYYKITKNYRCNDTILKSKIIVNFNYKVNNSIQSISITIPAGTMISNNFNYQKDEEMSTYVTIATAYNISVAANDISYKSINTSNASQYAVYMNTILFLNTSLLAIGGKFEGLLFTIDRSSNISMGPILDFYSDIYLDFFSDNNNNGIPDDFSKGFSNP